MNVTWVILLWGPTHCFPGRVQTSGVGAVTVLTCRLFWVGLTWAIENSCRSVFLHFSKHFMQTARSTAVTTILSICPNFFHLIGPSWPKRRTNTEYFERKLFDSCSLNAISFRVDLRALPLKNSAIDPSLRVQATPWVNFNRWKFFLGYSNIPNPDQPWRGSVLTRKMSECGNGSPHWENKTHILLMVGWGLSCPHTKKSMWHSCRTKVSRDLPWKGAHFSYRENHQGMPLGKQCWWVMAGTRMEACFPSLLMSLPLG